MRKFKKIDFEINVILIILCTVFAFCKQGASFFIGYFIVGMWQILSLLIHYYKNWFCEKGTKRRNYQSLIITLLIITAVGFIIYPIIIIVAFILLFAAPVMAVYYTWICYDETYIKMQRPLSVLK
ncbi:hypothetical protein [Ferruginibacter sp.]